MAKKYLNEWLETILNFYSTKIGLSTEKDGLTSLFLLAIKKHKLEGRVYISDILKMKNANLLDKQILVAHLMFEKKRIIDMFELHTQAVREINQEFKRRGINELPIVIKGISVYGLTNDIKNKRRTIDIDLIYSEPTILESILLDLGYRREERFSKHEYSIMFKNKITIEIHNYIPILDYSNNLIKKSNSSFLNNKNIFFEIATLEEGEIHYHEILRSTQVFDYLAEGLLIPNVHYQIVIICTHVFRNYVNSQFSFSSHIKMAELLDIIDLLNHSSFKCDQFEVIVNETNSLTSVLFVGYLLERIFGVVQIQGIFSDYQKEGLFFPKNLQWSGAMYIPSKTEEYIYFGLNEFIENLGTEEVIISENNFFIEVPNIQRYNSHGMTHVELVEVKMNQDVMIIFVKLKTLILGQTVDVFEIFAEDKRCCFAVEDNKITSEERPEGCSWSITDQDYTVKIEIPVRILDFYLNSEFCLLLSVTRWGTGPLSTFIPIKILNNVTTS